jgi:hypothetical protein
MTIDHFGYIFTPSFEMPLRLIGRLSFPIFVFLLTFNLTQKDLFKKYITRLTSFAVITSLILIPLKYQIGNVLPLNIFWTLLLGVITIYGINKATRLQNKIHQYIIVGYTLCFSSLLSVITDYELFGLLYILSLYGWLKSKHFIFAILTLAFAILMNLDISVWASVIAGIASSFFLFPLKKSPASTHFLKPWWLFYAYYPIHLAILYAIKIYYHY